MARKITRPNLFAGMLGLAMLTGVVAGGLREVQAARQALAGPVDGWPAGACEQINRFDPEVGADRPELLCWTSDFVLNVPEPGLP